MQCHEPKSLNREVALQPVQGVRAARELNLGLPDMQPLAAVAWPSDRVEDTRIRRSHAAMDHGPAWALPSGSKIRRSDAPSGPRLSSSPEVIRRVKTKVLPAGQRIKGSEEKEIETDDLALLDLILLLKANPVNDVLRREVERRAAKPTEFEIMTLFASPLAPIQMTFKVLPQLVDAALGWFKQLDDQTAEGLLHLLTPVGALKFATVCPGVAPKDLKQLAGAAAKVQKSRKEIIQEGESTERLAREQQRLTQFLLMFSGLLMQFVVNLPEECASWQLVKALSRLDTLFRKCTTMAEACEMASGIVFTVKQLVEAFEIEEEPDLMRRQGGDVVAHFMSKQRERQRVAEKVLRRHFPQMIGCLNYADPQCVVYQRYRGSLTDGLKNEEKSVSLGMGRPKLVRVINLNSFDIDAFLEIDSATWKRWEAAGLFPLGQAIKDGKIGLRALSKSLRYQKDNAKTEETRALAERLYKAVQELLTLELQIQDELAEISGYKRTDADRSKGDFGFLLQSSTTTESQTKRGKRYPADQLAATNLRLTDLLHIEVRRVAVGEDAIEIGLGERQRTIGDNFESKKTRARSHTI